MSSSYADHDSFHFSGSGAGEPCASPIAIGLTSISDRTVVFIHPPLPALHGVVSITSRALGVSTVVLCETRCGQRLVHRVYHAS